MKLRGGLPPRGRDKEGRAEARDGEKPEKREEEEDRADDSGRRR